MEEYLATDAPDRPPVIPEGVGYGEDAMLLHFIDVGQGAATLVELPCGALLVDTGGEHNEQFDSERALLAYLDAFFARRTDLERTLDSLIITHPHIDHTRSIRAVLERYAVRNVVDNGDVREDLGGEPQLYLHRWLHGRDVGHLDVGADDLPPEGLAGPVVDPIPACPRSEIDPGIRVLWGARLGREEVGHDPNDDSVVVRLDYGEASALLAGDIERLAIAWITKHYAAHPELLDADLYHVPHHGSRHSTAQHLVAAVSPLLAVISMGPYERHLRTDPEYSARSFGHPNRDALDHLRDPEHGVRARRATPIEAMIGLRGAWKETPSEFERATIEEAIYATGWDGHIVVTAYPSGELTVWTAGR